MALVVRLNRSPIIVNLLMVARKVLKLLIGLIIEAIRLKGKAKPLVEHLKNISKMAVGYF